MPVGPFKLNGGPRLESTFPTLKLSVHLDDDGNCALTDKGGAIPKPWQVRRKALEETLFGSK